MGAERPASLRCGVCAETLNTREIEVEVMFDSSTCFSPLFQFGFFSLFFLLSLCIFSSSLSYRMCIPFVKNIIFNFANTIFYMLVLTHTCICFSILARVLQLGSQNEISLYSSNEISGNESNEAKTMTESERQADFNRQKEEMKIKRRKKKRTSSSMQSSTFKGKPTTSTVTLTPVRSTCWRSASRKKLARPCEL